MTEPTEPLEVLWSTMPNGDPVILLPNGGVVGPPSTGPAAVVRDDFRADPPNLADLQEFVFDFFHPEWRQRTDVEWRQVSWEEFQVEAETHPDNMKRR